VVLPGLDDDATYDVRPLPPGDHVAGPEYAPLPWWSTGLRLPGRVLGTVGVQLPALNPEQLVLLEAVRVP
jgi:alpha-galactosidase